MNTSDGKDEVLAKSISLIQVRQRVDRSRDAINLAICSLFYLDKIHGI